MISFLIHRRLRSDHGCVLACSHTAKDQANKANHDINNKYHNNPRTPHRIPDKRPQLFPCYICSSNFCHLITFVNSLDSDQDQHNVGPDLNSKRFGTLTVFLKEFVEKVNFEKSQQATTKA